MCRIKQIQQLAVIALGALGPTIAAADDYIGTLRLPRNSLETPTGLYSFTSGPLNTFNSRLNGTDSGYRLQLGYKYSRYLSVETEYVDSGFSATSPFANPSNLASAFRSTGISVDTIVPVWNRFSFYGRLGAQRGDPRGIFSSNAITLIGSDNRTRLRYGMGVRYDFTRSLGVYTEMERYSPLGSAYAGEAETDLFSVGLRWRF